MNTVFYLASAVAVLLTIMVICQMNIVHALLYLIVSLLAVAVVFFTLGAPFVAALEVIIYAGAIMVLFVFVIMMLGLGPGDELQERIWFSVKASVGPVILATVLFAGLATVLVRGLAGVTEQSIVDAKQVGASLLGPYLIGLELASVLLLAGLVGAYHLGQGKEKKGGMS